MRLKRLARASGDGDQRSGGGRHRRSACGTSVRQPAEGSRPDGDVHRPVLHPVPRRRQLVRVDHAVHVGCVMRRVMAASAAALAIALTVLLGPAHPASAASTDVRIADAAHWAATQVGKPYVYGGIGPYGYDCSGLVYTAYRRYGFALPRTTYQLLASWHLYRVSSPRRGDLAFYGSGHVEILTGTWGTAPVVTGADGSSYNGNTLTLHFAQKGQYKVSII